MDRIYNDAKDKNVAKVIVYIDATSDSSNAYVCSDSKLTKKMTTSELKDAFYKGCIARYSHPAGYPIDFSPVNYYKPSDSDVGFIVGIGQFPGSSNIQALAAQSIPDPT